MTIVVTIAASGCKALAETYENPEAEKPIDTKLICEGETASVTLYGLRCVLVTEVVKLELDEEDLTEANNGNEAEAEAPAQAE